MSIADRIGGQNHTFTGRELIKGKRLYVQVKWQHVKPNDNGQFPWLFSWIPIEYLTPEEKNAHNKGDFNR